MTVTDQQLALMLAAATEIKRQAHDHWAASVRDAPEREAALNTMRQAGTVVRTLESWMVARIVRATASQS